MIGPQVKHPKNAGGGGTREQAGSALIAPAETSVRRRLACPHTRLGIRCAAIRHLGPLAPGEPLRRGAALPPRGGSGNAELPVTADLIQGHTVREQAPPAPESGPAFAFLPPVGGSAARAATSAAPVVTRNAAAAAAAQAQGSGGGGGGIPARTLGAGGGIIPVFVDENPSSMPASTDGNSSGFSAMSFPYFPLYVLDQNNGIVLFNGQYQQANLSGVFDLDAQVKGATVSTYSWTTNNLGIFSSSGANTYHFHFVLSATQAAPVGSVTLTVTDSNSHQESETFYFVVPTSNLVTMPTSSSWPVTIPANLVEPVRAGVCQPGRLGRCDLRRTGHHHRPARL